MIKTYDEYYKEYGENWAMIMEHDIKKDFYSLEKIK